jgi:hypothetical protein
MHAQDNADKSTYGPLWLTSRNLGSGPDAFVSLSKLAYAPNGRLYVADANVGIVELETKTGLALKTYANENIKFPTGLALAADNTLYVGDSLCQCILTLTPDRQWQEPMGAFAPQSPASLALTADGTLYATEQTETGIIVRAFKGKDERKVAFSDEVIAQPLLGTDAKGGLLALTIDGAVLKLDGDRFVALYNLNTNPLTIQSFAVDKDEHFVLATKEQGVTILDKNGTTLNTVGRLVKDTPGPGDLLQPRGVALGPDGTIYIADSDDSFGTLLAMSTRVPPGRVGAPQLISGLTVLGMLDKQTPEQDWQFTATAGQQVTIAAVDASQSGALDMTLRLIAPDGKDEAANDNQTTGDLLLPTDAEIPDHTFKATGVYTIRAGRVNSAGLYALALSAVQPLQLDKDNAEVVGILGGPLPARRWSFQGRAGQVVTITVTPTSDTLDPSLRLLDATAKVLAENDDAADTTLGRGAQIAAFKLPSDGVYGIEARRFNGEGNFRLTVGPPTPPS